MAKPCIIITAHRRSPLKWFGINKTPARAVSEFWCAYNRIGPITYKFFAGKCDRACYRKLKLGDIQASHIALRTIM